MSLHQLSGIFILARIGFYGKYFLRNHLRVGNQLKRQDLVPVGNV